MVGKEIRSTVKKDKLEKSRMKKLKLRGEKGITLIALVITVIIMLILAGVAISVLTDGDGLFEKTQIATDAYSEAVQNEAEQIKTLMNKIDVYIDALPKKTIQAVSVVSVGDFINYDAGKWEEGDLEKITSSAGNPTLHSTVNDATDNNRALPTIQRQFGGFELGYSRNKNSIERIANYKPRTEGWRVWDKDETTGVVTLISAGYPESYYHTAQINYSPDSINVLTNRNCSMYENSHAQTGSAHILTGQEAVTWYNKQYETSYTVVENGENSTSTFYGKEFSTDSPIEVLEINSHYWLASAYDNSSLYYFIPNYRNVIDGNNFAFGVRILVSLKPDTLLELGTGDGSENNRWEIAEN